MKGGVLKVVFESVHGSLRGLWGSVIPVEAGMTGGEGYGRPRERSCILSSQAGLA